MAEHASLEAALAAPRTPLVGRAKDVEEARRWLDEGARIVVIAGPAGIGKTRVALEVARTSEIADAVVWVNLAGTTDDASIFDAIRRAANIAEEDGRADSSASLARALRAHGDVLLMLDGLDTASARMGETIHSWLAAAPELRIVVASRERTRVAGEIVHEIGPLPEALELFALCAKRIRAGFDRAADPDSIAAIARELAGVPLAIELAAARLSVMGPRALLHRLRSGSSGIADALECAMNGSWTSLDSDEQRALAFLSVFRGGFTIDAAEAVLDVTRAPVDVVGSLRDKSLLSATEDAHHEVRLDLQSSVRAFAEKRLDAIPEARAIAESRHAAFYAQVAARLATRDGRARETLIAERENLLAVVGRVARPGDAGGAAFVSARVAEPALRALLALAPLLFSHGPLRAWEVIVDPAIAKTRGSGADPALVAEVLLVRGALRRHRGAASEGARDLVHALSLARTLASAPLEATATLELGLALEDAGDLIAAEDHFRRAAALFTTAGNLAAEGRALANLAALLARTERAELARAPMERALSLHSADVGARADDLLTLGAIELASGRIAAARTVTEESLVLSREHGEGRASGLAWMQLGVVASRAGDPLHARECFERAASMLAELGFAALSAICGVRVGEIAKAEGRLAEAQIRLREARDVLLALHRTQEITVIDALLREIETPSASPPPLPEDALVVAAEGAWFRAPRSSRVDLLRRRPLAAITARLTSERTERPASPIAARALQEAAWPGEKIVASAGAHRVRVAISSLRKLGLPIVTTPEGYALDPAIPLSRA